MTKKYLFSFVLICTIFTISCSGDCTTTTNVGRANAAIMVVNSDGSNNGIYTSDSNGNITHPCGTSVGLNQ